jgi:hypothetical protein
MNGKSWVRAASTVFAAVVILVGVAWALPGNLDRIADKDLRAAVGGFCHTSPCHYTSACANTDDGYKSVGGQSTYFYYKSGSAQLVDDQFQGSVGDCRVHWHYSGLNCTYYLGTDYDWWVDIGC